MPNKDVEVWSFFEEMGPKIICKFTGEIELYDICDYGSVEHYHATYDTLSEAMMIGEKFT